MQLNRQPTIRITPPNGDATTIDLRSALQTAPNAGPASIGVKFPLDRGERMTVNRGLRSDIRGFRMVVTLVIVDGPNAYDSDIVAQILNALLDQTMVVAFALDGATFYDVELSADPAYGLTTGKTAGGPTWTIEFSSKQLITEFPTPSASVL